MVTSSAKAAESDSQTFMDCTEGVKDFKIFFTDIMVHTIHTNFIDYICCTALRATNTRNKHSLN